LSSDLLKSVAQDLFAIMPLIVRGIRRRFAGKGIMDILGSGITPAHVHILRILRFEGTLNVTGIGQKLLIRGPQMTYLIDNLVDQGMVERVPDPNDRRVINIVLTDKGRKILESHEKTIIDSISANLSALSEDELKELSTSLRSLKEILSRLG